VAKFKSQPDAAKVIEPGIRDLRIHQQAIGQLRLGFMMIENDNIDPRSFY
jgi:hypothetical protein